MSDEFLVPEGQRAEEAPAADGKTSGVDVSKDMQTLMEQVQELRTANEELQKQTQGYRRRLEVMNDNLLTSLSERTRGAAEATPASPQEDELSEEGRLILAKMGEMVTGLRTEISREKEELSRNLSRDQQHLLEAHQIRSSEDPRLFRLIALRAKDYAENDSSLGVAEAYNRAKPEFEEFREYLKTKDAREKVSVEKLASEKPGGATTSDGPPPKDAREAIMRELDKIEGLPD